MKTSSQLLPLLLALSSCGQAGPDTTALVLAAYDRPSFTGHTCTSAEAEYTKNIPSIKIRKGKSTECWTDGSCYNTFADTVYLQEDFHAQEVCDRALVLVHEGCHYEQHLRGDMHLANDGPFAVEIECIAHTLQFMYDVMGATEEQLDERVGPMIDIVQARTPTDDPELYQFAQIALLNLEYGR